MENKWDDLEKHQKLTRKPITNKQIASIRVTHRRFSRKNKETEMYRMQFSKDFSKSSMVRDLMKINKCVVLLYSKKNHSIVFYFSDEEDFGFSFSANDYGCSISTAITSYVKKYFPCETDINNLLGRYEIKHEIMFIENKNRDCFILDLNKNLDRKIK